jgi:hypothetical protein
MKETGLAQSVNRTITALVMVTLLLCASATRAGNGHSFRHQLRETLARSQQDGKPVAVVFVAAWCELCGRLNSEVLPSPEITRFADDFHWVMIDIDRKLTVAREHNVEGVPKIVLLDPRGGRQVEIDGLIEAPALEARLEAFLTRSDQPHDADHDCPSNSLSWNSMGYRARAICYANVGYGPLRLDSQSPLQGLRLGIRPRTPSTLGRGQYQIDGTLSWVNVWGGGDADIRLDYEMLQTNVALAYGLADTVQIEGELLTRSRFGGGMDGLVQGFHNVFGVEQGGRDLVPRGEFTFELDGTESTLPVAMAMTDRGVFSRSVGFTAQHNITCGRGKLPAFSYSGTMRYETADSGDFNGGSNLDVGISAAASRRYGIVYPYLTLGYTWFGRDDFRGLMLRDTQWTVLAALEFRVHHRMAVILQFLKTQGVVEDFEPFSQASNEITIGLKWELRSAGILEVGLLENIFTFGNSPDFGLHVGFSRRFDMQ